MSVTELKNIIKTKVLEGYRLKTNFSSEDFFIEVGNLIIIAKPICTKEEVRYEFLLDTQFVSSKEIDYKELKMIKEIIEILELHRKTAISKLRKWTVKEYEEDKKLKKEQSEKVLEALKSAFMMKK